VTALHKRYYIIFVARQEDGELRKIPIPLHYAYVFVAAAVIGLFTITGMAGSYSRMLLKTARFNQVRTERETIRHDYLQMEQVAHEKDVQAASLGSLASEVSALYGLRQSRVGKTPSHLSASPKATDGISDQQYSQSFDQLLCQGRSCTARTSPIASPLASAAPLTWLTRRLSGPCRES
jgi:hypothetical protein